MPLPWKQLFQDLIQEKWRAVKTHTSGNEADLNPTGSAACDSDDEGARNSTRRTFSRAVNVMIGIIYIAILR